jgi:branched-chain amino acid transport system ATP-binding protein
MLQLDDVHAGYDEGSVLKGVSLSVEDGSVTTLLGRNGVGKTTTLRTIMGILKADRGTIALHGEDLVGLEPYEVYRKGIGMVMEDRGIFPELTIEENLLAPTIPDSNHEWAIEEIYEMLPTLREHRGSKGETLSGGEQQMLTFGRALRCGPDLLLLDEVTEGLAPKIVATIAQTVDRIAERDTTVLLVEQNTDLALDLGSYHYIMDSGRIVSQGPTDEIRGSSQLERYLGVHTIRD